MTLVREDQEVLIMGVPIIYFFYSNVG